MKSKKSLTGAEEIVAKPVVTDQSSQLIKKHHYLRNCFIGLLISIVIPIILALMFGLFRAPVLSAILYHPPKPSRIVSIKDIDKDIVERTFKQLTDGHLPADRLVPVSTGRFGVRFTEAEMTAALGESVINRQRLREISSVAQLTFEPGRSEIFVVLIQPPSHIQAVGRVTIQGNHLAIEFDRLRIGTLPLPKFLSSFVATKLNETLTTNDSKDLKEIRFEDRAVVLIFEVGSSAVY